jgi:hypothetical protein
MEYIILRFLALIGIAAIIAAIAVYKFLNDDMARTKGSKYPWGEDGTWYVGKPKKSKRIRE